MTLAKLKEESRHTWPLTAYPDRGWLPLGRFFDMAPALIIARALAITLRTVEAQLPRAFVGGRVLQEIKIVVKWPRVAGCLAGISLMELLFIFVVGQLCCGTMLVTEDVDIVETLLAENRQNISVAGRDAPGDQPDALLQTK